MAQQTTTLTRSNMKFSDQRFAAGHESSPKNDISCSSILSAHQQIKVMRNAIQPNVLANRTQVSPQRLAMMERLQHLKMFSRGQSPEQICDVAVLKAQALPDAIKAQFPELGQRVFQRHELYEFLSALSCIEVGEGQWHFRENAHELIVYTSYGSVFPGLRFQKRGEHFHCKGFNFDIRLAA